MKEIELTQGFKTQVDDDWFESLNQHKWCYDHGYARAWIDGKAVLMHQLILGCKGCDHRDRNKLNNQELNLRPADKVQNGSNKSKAKNNTSGYTGVTWNPSKQGNWIAQVTYKGKTYNLGHFYTAEEASKKRDQAAKRLHGDFARLNEEPSAPLPQKESCHPQNKLQEPLPV